MRRPTLKMLYDHYKTIIVCSDCHKIIHTVDKEQKTICDFLKDDKQEWLNYIESQSHLYTKCPDCLLKEVQSKKTPSLDDHGEYVVMKNYYNTKNKTFAKLAKIFEDKDK